jgi:hypothetical protein
VLLTWGFSGYRPHGLSQPSLPPFLGTDKEREQGDAGAYAAAGISLFSP